MTKPDRRRISFLVVLGLGLGLGLARADDRPVDLRVGRPLANFTLKGGDGTPFSLYGLAGKKAAVLVFLGTDCPNANVSLPRLIAMSKAYEGRGVAFLAINSNAGESAEAVAAHAKEHGIPFPVLKDPNNVVADLALADRTPEVIALDGRAAVRYRGAIDDQYAQGKRKPEPTRNYLSDALDAIIVGRPVEVASTPVVGCPIQRVDRKLAAAASPRVRPAAPAIVAALGEREAADASPRVGPVTYAADVAPIVAEKCQSCHRPGQVGPFSLRTYDDARRHSAAIAEVVADRRMPPWHADPRFGHFGNDRSLTPKQRATLLAWVEQGAPLGDPAGLPPARSFADGWSIGTPDLVIETPRPYEVPSQGVLDYVHVEVTGRFDRDTWVQAVEILPSERAVVHHVIVYLKDPAAKGRGHLEHLAAYVPGDTPTTYPDGIAKKIPANATLVFQIHYTPDGTPRLDRTRLGLILAKKPVEHRARTMFVQDTKFRIPPGADDHEVRSTHTTRADVHLFSLSPHMHLRGKDFKYTATYPDGRSEVLLSVPAYDFGWQSAYILTEPTPLPKGTRIDCVAHFDNSANNPANPDPAVEVRWGEQSFQEMMMGYLDYVEDAPAEPRPRADGPFLPPPDGK